MVWLGRAHARREAGGVTGPDEARTAYDGNLISVTIERWGEHEREIVEHPGAVAIVAIDREGYITLVRQLRETARRPLVELPAGGLEAGEEPLESAKRELTEETGLAGGRWTQLAAFYTTPGFCREYMTLFLAEDLERGEPSPDSDEEVEIVRWRIEELESRLGEIEDAKTLGGLLAYLRRKT